ncbi:hypothetical protein LX77_02687 [Gelidibacter algens]|jgi:hypothetical protein|uniref:DUF6933 domain-containing protein n=1 Tax=Gelidibacter algens TaxID=49280 RepID=A0A1A7R8Y0_9FLAO|nr:hypothetical protein [Gelidibacter algens]OBX27177.1 hypothetical protein A9996_00140 [Gelidibacter algens]RAJ22029.1 hypothetical protein LX77_02687 [Gelidibacter algens]
MRTPIHTSKKLEKLITKIVKPQSTDAQCGILGKWNATVFYVDRKKCWLILNAKTQYAVILTDIKSSDLNAIDDLFKNAFYSQLIYDGMIKDFEKIDALIGRLDFLPTDNDKKTTGFQNYKLQDLKIWQYQFGTLEDMPMKELSSRLNRTPIHLGTSKKMSEFTTSTEAMNILLSF